MAGNTTNSSIRIDTELKTQADALFSELGIPKGHTVTHALTDGLPFDVTLNKPNKETIAAMLEAERIAKDPAVKGYTDLNQFFADLKE